jgi:hypothetical protein
MKYKKMLMEINEDLSNEIKDIDYKIKFINDNSEINIEYKDDFIRHYLIEIGNEKEILNGFDLASIIRDFFSNTLKNSFILSYGIERDNYIKFKKKIR